MNVQKGQVLAMIFFVFACDDLLLNYQIFC
jgi:hypothetical protein